MDEEQGVYMPPHSTTSSKYKASNALESKFTLSEIVWWLFFLDRINVTNNKINQIIERDNNYEVINESNFLLLSNLYFL